MKISALRLANVKRFAGRGVAIEGIGDGVNVLSAANEFGKSTSFEALHALFFTPYSSKGKDAAALKPYSGGSPLVEADVETDDGRYRITKQFFGGASAQVTDLATGRLLAQADEAESFLAELIRGGAGGPAGMLWVRQGLTGLDKRSRAEEDSERHVRETLLQSVQGEVEAVTGGRRMADIMRGVSEDLSALVTATGKPKTGGRYAAAKADRDLLAAEEERLREEVAVLRDALDKRAQISQRLAELTNADEAAQRAQQLKAATETLEAAREQEQQLHSARTELELAKERHANAQRKYDEFVEAHRQLEALQLDYRAVLKRRDDAQQEREALRKSVDEVQAALDAAETSERDARTLIERIDLQAKSREAAERLAGLRQKLAAAQAAQQAIDEHAALNKQLQIGAASIQKLAALDVEIAQLEMLRKATRPSVQVTYQDGAAARILMDGAPLVAGTEHDYGSHAELSIAGIGTMTLRSNWEDDASRIDGLREKRAAVLASMGVADLAAAHNQQARADDHKALKREAEIQLGALVPEGIAGLIAEIAACQLTAGDDAQGLIDADPAQVRAALEAGLEKRRLSSEKLRALSPSLNRADDALRAAATLVTEVTVKIDQLRALVGAPHQQDGRRTALADALAPLTQDFEAAGLRFKQLSDRAVDLEGAQASFNRVKSVQKAVETSIAQAQIALAGLNAEIRSRAQDAVEEKWRETEEALAGAEQRVAAFEREVAILRCLSETLEAARSEARDLYLKPVMSELMPLLGLLFDDVNISFDEKTLLPEKLVRNGFEEEVDRLSGGMREQLSVLTRLAFARLMIKDGRPTPVILDDALVYSDDDRIEKMFDALHRQSQGQQIIVFSCRQRAFQKLGGNVLQMTDWHR
jgi:DNA repair exonuclease SbcCD ATPase subunit